MKILSFRRDQVQFKPKTLVMQRKQGFSTNKIHLRKILIKISFETYSRILFQMPKLCPFLEDSN